MSEWKPIDSAPKDGTRVLFGRKAWVTIGRWQTVDYDHYAGMSIRAWVADTAGRESPRMVTDFQPTHWQPLPPPPDQEPAR